MTFFQKVHFIQKCSVTQNTVFQYVKNIFLLSQKKLVFFTILNLGMVLNASAVYNLLRIVFSDQEAKSFKRKHTSQD